MRQMSPQWQSRQVADVLAWLRDYNAGRADKVQFVGVEYYLLGSLAYDAVDAYVASTAPGRLAELRRHLRVIRPANREHVRVHPVVPAASDSLVYRDAHAAQNLRWWHDFSGDKIAYWAASAHTANAPRLRIAVPPDPDWRYPTAGSYLRRWYGQRYRSVGFTFDHGTVSLGPEGTVALPQPAPDWFERPFGKVGLDQFALDLRTPAPPPVHGWLQAPIKTRGLADRGPDSYMAGGTLAQWFDVIVHCQELTPT
jgi:erythromycin esterase-like protein